MAALRIQIHPTTHKTHSHQKTYTPLISCSIQQPPQTNIKVVINGAAKEIGMAAVLAVTKSRGMELAGAVDSHLVGQDIGKVCGMEEALEIPIINDLTMVLGSISQGDTRSKATSVVVDFTDPSTVYDNVKQATAFGMNSVVYVPRIKPETIAALSGFCEKASMGCLVAPTLSIGSILLQQAAISASFHYNNVEIVDLKLTQEHFRRKIQCKSPTTSRTSGSFTIETIWKQICPARGQRLGEDGIRVHSLVLPGLCLVHRSIFSGPGEVFFYNACAFSKVDKVGGSGNGFK
ncbi:putative 4-hydroxy-tetrahydrodipicolinate reductase [Helianthus annuus]|nr:putative 4-hydroxy-tetrahydrodipicolinate reductase [Helianthus annuus]